MDSHLDQLETCFQLRELATDKHPAAVIAATLLVVLNRLDRLETLLRKEGKQLGKIDDAVAALGAEIATDVENVKTAVTAEIEDVKALIAGGNTDAAVAALDALTASTHSAFDGLVAGVQGISDAATQP